MYSNLKQSFNNFIVSPAFINLVQSKGENPYQIAIGIFNAFFNGDFGKVEASTVNNNLKAFKTKNKSVFLKGNYQYCNNKVIIRGYIGNGIAIMVPAELKEIAQDEKWTSVNIEEELSQIESYKLDLFAKKY